MLTPSDFIFNEDPFSEYSEFNYDLVQTQQSSWTNSQDQKSYTYKSSLDSVKNSFSFDIVNYNVTGIPEDHFYFNARYIKNYVKELINLKNQSSYINDSTFPIFPGLRYLGQGIVVFERPPAHKIVSTHNDYRDAINDSTSFQEYFLPIPWQVYIAIYNPADMRLVSVKMFFAENSLSSFDQTLYSPPLYNFYSNGTLCRPFFSSMEDIEKYSKDISGIIASAYDWIWNSGFNFDITENISFFLQSKKHIQFEQYLNEETVPHMNWLKLHSINTIPMQLPHKYHYNLFKCWEQIPLSEVSSLSWITPTSTDFYYQQINQLRDTLIQEYIELHDLFIHDHNFDFDDHDDDECPEECLFYSEVVETNQFNSYITEKLNQTSYTLKDAVDSSYAYITGNQLTAVPNLSAKLKNFFRSVLQNNPIPS